MSDSTDVTRRALDVAVTVGLTLVAVTAAAADRRWVEARTDAIQVVSDAGEQHAVDVAIRLERMRALFADHLKARVDPGRPVVVFVVKDTSGLRELLPSYWQDPRRAGVAGVFLARADKHLAALTLDRDSFRTAYHEYAHLLTGLNASWLPAWLSEGLAEFYAATEIEGDGIRWGDVPTRHMQVLKESKALSLAELFAVDRSSRHYNEIGRTTIFYAQSTVLTHMLMAGDASRRGQVEHYLRLLEAGRADDEAQREAFGDLRRLEDELKAYLKRSEYKRFKVSLPAAAAPVRTRQVPEAEAAALRGDLLARTGRPREARPLLESALAREPGLALAHEGLGILQRSVGRYALALDHFREASRLDPSSASAFYLAGTTRNTDAPPKEDLARREQALREALATRADLAHAHSSLGRVIALRGERYDEAIASTDKAIALDPSMVWHRLAKWQVLRAAGREEAASRIEAELLRLSQADPSLLAAMVQRLETDEDAAASATFLQRAREAHPRDAMVLRVLALTMKRQRRWEEAEAAFRDALALSPESPVLLNELAYLLAEAARKLDEALVLVERALMREPRQPPHFVDTKAWVLFGLGRLEEAEKLLRDAVARHGSAVQLDHLADVLTAAGKTDQGLVTYKRVLDAPDASDELRAAVTAKVDRLRSGRP